jgi:hypothetical protein
MLQTDILILCIMHMLFLLMQEGPGIPFLLPSLSSSIKLDSAELFFHCKGST